MKSGFISIVGRPNVGKSTLLNSLLGKKIAITSSKPQTTRNTIEGILTTEDYQMVFVDTPGIHKPKFKLGKILNKQAYFSIKDVDIVMFLVDASEELGKGDMFVLNVLKETDKPVFLILNKIDKISNEEILLKIEEYKDLYNFSEIIPLSSIKGVNVEHLKDVLVKYLPDNIKYYDDNMITNTTREFVISELIREKILHLTNEEVPHSVSCMVESIEEDKNIVNIMATIIVDRDNLKKIIIGKNGSMIKEIGKRARFDIENYLGKRVYLELFVKVISKWRDKDKILNEIGFKDFNDLIE